MNFKNALKLATNLGAAEKDGKGYLPGASVPLESLAQDLEVLLRLAQG